MPRRWARRSPVRMAEPERRLVGPLWLSGVFWFGLAAAANAGEAPCWFENGAVVAPAEVAGIAGDYVIDPSSRTTLLHNTRAEAAGYSGTRLTVDVRLADRRLESFTVEVADLDERGYGFVTPIAGVIGADALEGQVLWLDFAPCRLRLEGAGWGGTPGRDEIVVPLERSGGLPVVQAAASDGRLARRGLFAIDWGSAGLARINAAYARLVPEREGVDPARRDLTPARLRAVSLAGRLDEQVPSGLIAGLDGALLGTLGVDYWSRWTVRLDLAANRLVLSPPDRPPPR